MIDQIGLEKVMEGRDDFPVIKWMLRNGTHPIDAVEHEGNYTQIVRSPYLIFNLNRDMKDAVKDRALADLLQSIESIIVHGVPHSWNAPGEAWHWGGCGGAMHYLGREPTEDDTIIYRPLAGRDVAHRSFEAPEGFECEWIVEFTLEIHDRALCS